MSMFEFESGTFQWFYYLYLYSFGESWLLVSWCAGDMCDMVSIDEDRGRSRIPGAEDRDGRIGRVLGGRTIEMSGGAMYGLHHAHRDKERGFLG
jgi:hypothetical protein